MYNDEFKQLRYILNSSGEIKLYILSLIVLFIIFILEFTSIAILPIFINIVINNSLDFNLGFIDLAAVSNIVNNNLKVSCSLLLILFVFKNLFVLLAVYVENIFTYKIITKLSRNLYQHYLKKNIIFFKNSNTSELFRNFSELKRIGSLLRTLQLFIRESVVIISMIILLLVINWKITIIASIFLITLTFLFFSFFKKISYRIGKEFQDYDGKRIKAFYQGLDSIKESRVYGITSVLKKIYYNALNKVEFIIVKTNLLNSLPRVFFEILAIAIFGLLIVLSIEILNIEKNKSIYFITIFSTVLVRLIPSFQQLASNFSHLNFYLPALKLIYKELNDKNYIDNSLLTMSDLNYQSFKSLKLKQVSFSYKDEDLLLSDLDLEIFKNQKIGIFGKSGSGKSTLIELITGQIKPISGEILINDQNIYKDKISINISYIPQDVYLYDTSIKKNINFDFLDNFNDLELERMDQSILNAQLDILVKKNKHGINAKVGQLGKMISGGQSQRVGIARALYKNSDLIILDEFTSSLDDDNEKKIMNIINSFTDKTIILISHKNNLFKDFDKIYELKNNKLTPVNKNKLFE